METPCGETPGERSCQALALAQLLGLGEDTFQRVRAPPPSKSQPPARPVKPSQPQLPGQILGHVVSLRVVCYSNSLERGRIIGDPCKTVHAFLLLLTSVSPFLLHFALWPDTV